MPTPTDRPDDALPPWAAELLGAAPPHAADALARAQARVMGEVRRAPRHGRPLAGAAAGRAYRLPAALPRWARRRGLFAPGVAVPGGALLAALLAVAGARSGWPSASGAAGAPAGLTVRATVLRDTVLGGAIGRAVRDTLRVVRFALAGAPAAGAGRVALAADFTGWRAAPLARDGRTGAWAVTLAVPRDAVRYAFVVDGPLGRVRVPGPPLPAAGRPSTAGDST